MQIPHERENSSNYIMDSNLTTGMWSEHQVGEIILENLFGRYQAGEDKALLTKSIADMLSASIRAGDCSSGSARVGDTGCI